MSERTPADFDVAGIVRFTGQLREENGAAPVALDEVWHLTKPRDGSKGWVVALILPVQ